MQAKMWVVVGMIATAVLSFGAAVRADTVSLEDWGTDPRSMAEWLAASSGDNDGVLVGDKVFKLTDFDGLPDYTAVQFTWDDEDFYATLNLTFTDTSNGNNAWQISETAADAAFLNYTVTIVEPDWFFWGVTLSPSVSGTEFGDIYSRKELDAPASETMNSTNGDFSEVYFDGQFTELDVHETFWAETSGGGRLSGSVNTFYQAVPLPAAFWAGIAMLGSLGVVRRFRASKGRKS